MKTIITEGNQIILSNMLKNLFQILLIVTICVLGWACGGNIQTSDNSEAKLLDNKTELANNPTSDNREVQLLLRYNETAVLTPNQSITFSLAPEQEKRFVLQMKKGEFAQIQPSARKGLNFTFEIYDLARNERFESEFNNPIWFVAPSDGDFMLVGMLAGFQEPEISGAQKISIQYNNKFELPHGAKLKGIRKVNGFDVKIVTMHSLEQGFKGDSVLLFEKHGQLQKIIKSADLETFGLEVNNVFYFVDDTKKAVTAKEKRSVQLIKTTPDKTGNGVPDIIISAYGEGAYCDAPVSYLTYFFELGDTVEIREPITHDNGFLAIGKNPKGGLIFEKRDNVDGSSSIEILEFRNGILGLQF